MERVEHVLRVRACADGHSASFGRRHGGCFVRCGMKRSDRTHRVGTPARPRVATPRNEPDPIILSIDLLRSELYRILDEMAQARDHRHAALVREFERAWALYRVTTAPR